MAPGGGQGLRFTGPDGVAFASIVVSALLFFYTRRHERNPENILNLGLAYMVFTAFALGLTFSLFTASANALVQLASPDHLRGRVVSLYLFAFAGLAPIGGIVAGWLADLGGTGLAFAVAGLSGLAAIAWAYRRLGRATLGPAPVTG